MNFNPEQCRNESEVESKLIVHYLLPKLGYSPDTWHQEVKFGKIRLDFLAFTQKLPFQSDRQSSISLIIEAKHPRKNLDKHIYQIQNYLISLDIAYGLLTNGKEIRIYEQSTGSVQLVFSCSGRDISDRLADIIKIIGRDFIKERLDTRSSLPQTTLDPISNLSPKESSMKTIATRDIYAEVGLITADYLIIPSDLKPFANQGLPTVKNFIRDINENREAFGKKPIELLGVLASKISTNARFIQYTFPKQRDVIGKRYEMPLMESVIYDRTALSESFNRTIIAGDIEYPDPKSIFKYADEVNSAAQTSAMEFHLLESNHIRQLMRSIIVYPSNYHRSYLSNYSQSLLNLPNKKRF